MFWWKFHIYFIGYLHDGYKVKPLHIMPSKVSPYVKSYDEQTKWMYFGIKGDELLDKYNTIWDKVSADKKKKEFDGKSVMIKNFWKPKWSLMVIKWQIFTIKKFLR